MNTITFIGGGNMATAIIGGLVASGTLAEHITLVEPDADKRAALADEFGVTVSDEPISACRDAATIVLAVKPQIISEVAASLNGQCNLADKLLISIAAGVTLNTLATLFGPMAMARTMPNTPALLGLGATGLVFNDNVSEAQRQQAMHIIESFGICVPVQDESLLDAVTAVSGSGPAYFFLLIEEMINAGVRLGLAHEDARRLTVQTALGAASMAAQSDVSAAELRRRVTSPNGTTHAAISSLQADGFSELIDKALLACRDRAIELGKA